MDAVAGRLAARAQSAASIAARRHRTRTGSPARRFLAWSAGAAAGQGVVIPARSDVRVLINRATLTSAYPTIVVSGGRDARVRVTYAEALVDNRRKGNRNEIEGGQLVGMGDEFLPDGGANRLFSLRGAPSAISN